MGAQLKRGKGERWEKGREKERGGKRGGKRWEEGGKG